MNGDGGGAAEAGVGAARSAAGDGADRADVSRVVVGIRLVAAGLAIGVAAVLVAVVPEVGRWWVGGPAVASLVVALLGGRFGAFAPWGLAASAVGVLLAASGNRLSVPTAAVIGLLLLGYLVLAELADSLDGDGTSTRLVALAGWLHTLSPVIVAGIAGAIVVAVVVVLPVPPVTLVVLVAPVALVAGVLLTVNRRFGSK